MKAPGFAGGWLPLTDLGSIPRASRYGVIYVGASGGALNVYRPASERRGLAGAVPLPTALAYSLDPGSPATVDPSIVVGSYADIDTLGNIAYESEDVAGSWAIYRGHLKAGLKTPVAISAGHGRRYTSDADNVGKYQRSAVGSVTEDIVSLEIARSAGDALSRYGVSNILPRNAQFITLPRSCYGGPPCCADYRQRVALAEARGAKVYVAVHTNALTNKSHGTLITRPANATIASQQLETDVLTAIVDRLPLKQRNPVIQGLCEYAYARNASPRVAYVEVAFHSNTAAANDQPAPYPLNNALLSDPAFLQDAGEAIARGVLGYLVRP